MRCLTILGTDIQRQSMHRNVVWFLTDWKSGIASCPCPPSAVFLALPLFLCPLLSACSDGCWVCDPVAWDQMDIVSHAGILPGHGPGVWIFLVFCPLPCWSHSLCCDSSDSLLRSLIPSRLQPEEWSMGERHRAHIQT